MTSSLPKKCSASELCGRFPNTEVKKRETINYAMVFMVPGEGFEPPKRSAADLQSAPFGHSGIPA